MAVCPNSVLNGPAFCSGGWGRFFAFFRVKLAYSLLNRRDSLHYCYWLGIYLLWAAPSRGIRLCEPYAYLSGKLSPEILKNMVHRAGLRAQIIEGGIIKVSEDVSG